MWKESWRARSSCARPTARGYRYHVEDVQLFAYADVPFEAKLRWLDEMRASHVELRDA